MKESKLLKDYPEVLKEWDYDLNPGVLTPDYLFAQSNKRYYWKCSKGHPSYLCSVVKKTIRKFGCPICSHHQIVAGINDFQTMHPELMDEWDWEKNNTEGITPDRASPSSNIKVWWKCKKCGNEWISSISNRVRMHSGCPYCSRKKAKKGFNDLQTTHPEIAKQWDYSKNGNFTPEDYVSGSFRKAWWICEKGHSWLAKIADRTKGRGCPYCSNNKVLIGFNDFQTTCPEAAKQWDYSKNNGKTPEQFTKGSEFRAWFKCEKGHSWKTRIAERGKGQGCPYCSNQRTLTGFNDIGTTNPELVQEWDFEKNTFSPYETNPGSNKRAWWLCSKCGYSWSSIISSRTKGYGCPKCGAERSTIGRLKKLASDNWIFDKYPELEKEWDYEKNSNIDISLVAAASNQYAWWKCEKGHSYRTRITTRTLRGAGCPYCHNQKVLTGINDLATLNPLLASEWDFEKNAPLLPNEVFSHGTKSVWWKCPVCGHSWKSKINNRANGRGCPNCSQAGTSFIEQSLFFYISKVFKDALNRHKYNGEYELDIYIPSINTAIEYDGSFYHSIKNSTSREKNKDIFCKSNGIRLIRLREKPLKSTTDSINISCSCKNWQQTEETIRELLVFLDVKSIPSISLKRDLTKIITSKRKLLKEKAFGVQFPNLLDEWDYEKNLPLIPDYFGKGSHVKVWWKCKNGHSFMQVISNRCSGAGCPECFEKRRKAGLHRNK